MRLVRCISERKSNPEQIKVGKLYWIDDCSAWKDFDGDKYAEIYLDEAKEFRLGYMLTNHFETVYRYLNHGGSLGNYINTHTAFLLKDIISWCVNNPNYGMSNNLILYIHDNKLDIKENMEKEFIINSVPFKNFAERGMADEYMKYMGYYLKCVN